MHQNRQISPDEQSLDPQLKALLKRAAKDTGARYASLLLCDQDTLVLRHAAWYGRKKAAESCAAIARWVLSRGEPLFLQEKEDAKKIVGSSRAKGMLPFICAPVMSNATPRGVLLVGFPPAAGQELSRRLPLLEILAELAGALLENAALQRDLYRKEEQVRDLIRHTLDAQEAERERICLEVHDGVTQTLASAFQYLQAVESASPEGTNGRQLLLRATTLVKQGIQESREVINSLRPSTLRDLGLVPTLRHEMRQLEQELGWQIDFEADTLRLPENVETGLYRIIREAITNVRKHAYRRASEVTHIRVTIECTKDSVKAEVRDWGAGFNHGSLDLISVKGRFGLLGMRKRAELLGGSCNIQSSPGQGTIVRVEIPLISAEGGE